MNLMYVAVICALIGLVFAFVLTKRVNSVDAGTDRMKEIASAIAEGARATKSDKLQDVHPASSDLRIPGHSS